MATGRKWTKVHEQQRAKILEKMQLQARPFEDCSPAATAARKALPFDEWLHTYCPHYATKPSSALHLAADLLCDEPGMPLAAYWFRGAGKTTRALLRRVKRIAEKKIHFGLVLGLTEDNAVEKLDLIQLELCNNERIRQDYGANLGPQIGANEENDWIAHGVRMLARGVGQSCRGLLHGPHRPDDVLGDDLEDDLIARNPKRMRYLWDWLFGNVFPALKGAGIDAYTEILLNNYGTRYCLKRRFQEAAQKVDSEGRPICRYVEFLAEDEEGKTTWPELYPQGKLQRMRAIMGERLYRREMLGKDEDDENAFRSQWIRTFKASEFDRSQATVRVGVDPSSKAAEVNCYKAIIVLARPHGTADDYCLHAWVKRASAREMVEHLIWVFDTFGPPWIGIEENGIGAMVNPLLELEQELRRRVERIALRPITNTVDKDDRILGVAPHMEQGHCYFDPSEGDQRLLMDQFLDFGKTSVMKDGPDGYEMAHRQLPKVAGLDEAEYYTSGGRRTNFGAMVA
jgi:hypothetical protein